jgi:hypothetical protein
MQEEASRDGEEKGLSAPNHPPVQSRLIPTYHNPATSLDVHDARCKY